MRCVIWSKHVYRPKEDMEQTLGKYRETTEFVQGVTMARVLLIEDDEMSRDMLSRRLTRRGYEVLTAADGQEGIALARSEAPEIILMDMSLPVLDGWEATRRLKSTPETGSIPIIALTAYAMTGDRERAIEVGCDDYDTKPVELSRLLEKMSALLSPKERDP